MYGYLFRRLLGTIPVMLVVAVFIFLMLRLTPSDPAAVIAGDNATTEQVAQIRSQLGLDRPMIEQFFIWSGKVLTGDFGESFFFKKTVASLISERIEPTLSLSLFTIVLAVLIAVRVFDAVLRDRVSPDLSVRGVAGLVAGAGLSADCGGRRRLG
jgi:peptide/nickel transport system permease protein